jgi:hypothetical protein
MHPAREGAAHGRRLGDVDLARVAHELYGVLPTEFVELRTQRAKQADDKQLSAAVRGLAKPSMAAWVVNQLVRHRTDQVEELIELGAALREAQSGLDGAELRRLDQQRRQLTRAVALQGQELAAELGQSVSQPAAVQIADTLHAAMADPDAAEAVRTGRLTRALSATGFGPVDLDGAVAAPDALASVTDLADKREAAARAERERALVQARTAAMTAERDAREAEAAAEGARAELARIEQRTAELKDEVRRLKAALDEAAAARTDLTAAAKRARKAVKRAEAEEVATATAAAAATADLDRLAARTEGG